jgi:hypothetical protein
MRVGYLSIKNVAVFALSREKTKKKIERSWDLNSSQLRKPIYSTFNKFLTDNVTILFNKGEAYYLHSKDIKSPPLLLASVDARKERSRAYLVPFKKKGSKRNLLNEVRNSKSRHELLKATNKIASLFRQTPFWPKSYLFVIRFNISYKSFRHNFVGIFITRLEQGRLAEDATKIIEQLKRGIIGDVVKKGLIYPHVTRKKGKLLLERKAKSYEDTAVPASYFYTFLALREPEDTVEILSERYEQFRDSQPEEGMEGFRDWLGDKENLLEVSMVNVEIDNINIKVPLEDIDERILITALKNGNKGVLIKGKNVRVMLGDMDILKDNVIKVSDKKQLIDLLKFK